jgi:hypothetical protein
VVENNRFAVAVALAGRMELHCDKVGCLANIESRPKALVKDAEALCFILAGDASSVVSPNCLVLG